MAGLRCFAPGARALLGAVSLLVALAACRSGASDATIPPPDAEDGGTATAPDAPPPRRPARRYYLGRTQERCEVYAVEGGASSVPSAVTCPAGLHVGERLRLSGKACFRESPSDPSREVPVICPASLWLRAESERTHRDAGN